MNEFITIKNNIEVQIVEKKSKFIANLFYVESQEQINESLNIVKKKYHDAKHNCIAYRIFEDNQVIERFSDDGEPSGTAGSPMLKILQKNDLGNILIVVTRYFGGVLLGTGGLVRAYSESLILAIEKAEIIKKCLGEEVLITVSYAEFENFKYYCKNNNILITNTEYFENIVCKVELETNKIEKLISDYEEKKVNINNIERLSKKYIIKI